MKDAKTKGSPIELIPALPVERCILGIRGEKVILDADLAALYGVSTKALNQAVRRNSARFPEDFAFLLTPVEKAEVVTNCDHLRRLKFSPVSPRAFTEHGALMAANILNSPRAVAMSVYVIRAFVEMPRPSVFCILHSTFCIHFRLRRPNLRSASTSKKTPSRTAPAGDERPEQRPGL